jgi:hypothetical protein
VRYMYTYVECMRVRILMQTTTPKKTYMATLTAARLCFHGNGPKFQRATSARDIEGLVLLTCHVEAMLCFAVQIECRERKRLIRGVSAPHHTTSHSRLHQPPPPPPTTIPHTSGFVISARICFCTDTVSSVTSKSCIITKKPWGCMQHCPTLPADIKKWNT